MSQSKVISWSADIKENERSGYIRKASSNTFARQFDYPPPNFEKPSSEGWTMIARAIICPEDRLGKYINYAKRWKQKEIELAHPHYIKEYKPRKRRRSKLENFGKKVVTIMNSDYDKNFGENSSHSPLAGISELGNTPVSSQVNKAAIIKTQTK